MTQISGSSLALAVQLGLSPSGSRIFSDLFFPFLISLFIIFTSVVVNFACVSVLNAHTSPMCTRNVPPLSSYLSDASFAYNQLTGPLSVFFCESLVFLGIQVGQLSDDDAIDDDDDDNDCGYGDGGGWWVVVTMCLLIHTCVPITCFAGMCLLCVLLGGASSPKHLSHFRYECQSSGKLSA